MIIHCNETKASQEMFLKVKLKRRFHILFDKSLSRLNHFTYYYAFITGLLVIAQQIPTFLNVHYKGEK